MTPMNEYRLEHFMDIIRFLQSNLANLQDLLQSAEAQKFIASKIVLDSPEKVEKLKEDVERFWPSLCSLNQNCEYIFATLDHYEIDFSTKEGGGKND